MNPKQIWIINEGNQGHVVQSRGLAREISEVVPVEIHEISGRFTPRSSFIRSVVKKIMRRWRIKWLFHVTHSLSEIPKELPDLVISSGPRSLMALEYYAKAHRCPSVFVQGGLSVPRGTVDVIMRPHGGEQRDDFVFIPLLFNEITPLEILRRKSAYLEKTGRDKIGPLNALFIGASSSKIVFDISDWDELAGLINRSFSANGQQWLISTSFRTGRDLEARLRENIDPHAIHDAVWYSSDPRKAMKVFLGMADRVYVTMDSMTMISEAVSSGLPVTVIRPAGMRPDLSNPHCVYVHGLERKGFISLSEPSGADLSGESGNRTTVDYGPAIRELLVRIGWNAYH